MAKSGPLATFVAQTRERWRTLGNQELIVEVYAMKCPLWIKAFQAGLIDPQSKDLCRTHGGGKRCDFPTCEKGVQRRGYCFYHHRIMCIEINNNMQLTMIDRSIE